MITYIIGWDVGAWNCDSTSKRKGKDPSRDSVCVFATNDGHSFRQEGEIIWANVREVIVNHSGKELLREFLQMCKITPKEDFRMVMAIDTPLGWPRPFRNLLTCGATLAVPQSADENPYLFRQSELFLFRRGKRPLSAIRDMIGSQSTKGLVFLNRALANQDGCGVWRSSLLTAIETYPAPCKENSPCLKSLKDNLTLHASTLLGKGVSDKSDAVVCALIAWLFFACPESLYPPPADLPEEEGWIWLPKDCLKESDE